jgi:hypothetical protein
MKYDPYVNLHASLWIVSKVTWEKGLMNRPEHNNDSIDTFYFCKLKVLNWWKTINFTYKIKVMTLPQAIYLLQGTKYSDALWVQA